jgi:hypothetical protein
MKSSHIWDLLNAIPITHLLRLSTICLCRDMTPSEVVAKSKFKQILKNTAILVRALRPRFEVSHKSLSNLNGMIFHSTHKRQKTIPTLLYFNQASTRQHIAIFYQLPLLQLQRPLLPCSELSQHYTKKFLSYTEKEAEINLTQQREIFSCSFVHSLFQIAPEYFIENGK